MPRSGTAVARNLRGPVKSIIPEGALIRLRSKTRLRLGIAVDDNGQHVIYRYVGKDKLRRCKRERVESIVSVPKHK